MIAAVIAFFAGMMVAIFTYIAHLKENYKKLLLEKTKLEGDQKDDEIKKDISNLSDSQLSDKIDSHLRKP